MPSLYAVAGGQGYPAQQTRGQSWPPRTSAAALVYCHSVMGIRAFFNRSTRRFGHRRVSRQPMGRFALCAVWSGWSCHRSCKLTIPPICPSNRTLLGVSAQTSIYILPSANHGDIDDPLRVLYSGSITWSFVDISYYGPYS